VNLFEAKMQAITGSKYAVAVVSGTCALQISLLIAKAGADEEVITQPLTFVGTANAIRHTGAQPHFVDVDQKTLGMSADKLEQHLASISKIRNGSCYNRVTNKRIAACVPMHTFGFPANIDDIIAVCTKYKIPVIEDAAESLGSTYKNRHTGTFGLMGAFSFNGNKIVTSGGGGAIVTDDPDIAKRAKHITTTAKLPHRWEYVHDEVGYNYRMPNLNAALACAQLEQLNGFLVSKRQLAHNYRTFFENINITFVTEQNNSSPNYWLNTIELKDKHERDSFLEYSNNQGVSTRPAWTLLSRLPMYASCFSGNLENAEYLGDRLVNLPSSVIK
jgi:aminotransferase in exopolysaccharide biosynthesis